MAARIISVTFETTTHARPGAFSIPRAAADVLGLREDGAVELRVTWEGRKLELATELRSGLEVHPRSSNPSTHGLESIPPKTPITVTVWRSGEAGAEDAVDTSTQSATRRATSELGQRYQRFFQRVLDRFQELRPGVASRNRVGFHNWLDFSAARGGFRFVWAAANRRHVRIELYIDTGDQATNKAMFEKLRQRASDLEGRLGMPISWEPLSSKRASRLAVYRYDPGVDFDSDTELIEWAAQTMARFVDVMSPVIKAL